MKSDSAITMNGVAKLMIVKMVLKKANPAILRPKMIMIARARAFSSPLVLICSLSSFYIALQSLSILFSKGLPN